jgi:RecA/RadA recombinase
MKMAAKKAEAVKKTETLTKAQKARALMHKMNRQANAPVMCIAEDVPSTYHLRRPSGIMQLDIDTGGGLPAGSFVTVAGPDNAGKSTLLYKYFGMHQRLFGRDSTIAAAFSECQLDYFAARKAGWVIAVPDSVLEAHQKERKLREVPPLTKEEVAELKREIGTNIMIFGETSEHLLDRLLEINRSNIFGIVALDSLEGMVPSAEAELDTLEDFAQQAAHASLLTRFMKKLNPTFTGVMGTNWTTFIATCQVRSNRKKSEVQSHIAKYMKDWAETVPRAVRHGRAINIVVQNGEKVYQGSKEARETIGKHMKWEIAKGKAGAHDNVFGEVEFLYDQPGFTRDLDDLLVCGMKYGAIREQEGLLTLVRSSGKPDQFLHEVPNKETFIEVLARDFELELIVRHEILAAAGKVCLYR